MDKSTAMLTVLFEDPFWIGLYEREFEGCYEVCKITFGTEPRDFEVYDFIINNFRRLSFSPSVETEMTEEKRLNPKRLQREVQKQLQVSAISTKAQQALSLQREQQKMTRKTVSREEREIEEARRYELHQEKRKAKHSGH